MSDVSSLSDKRLAALRSAERVLRDAAVHVTEAREEYGDLAQAFHVLRQRRERGLEVDVTDADETRLGEEALHHIEVAQEQYALAQKALEHEITMAVREKHIAIGDSVMSPRSLEQLTACDVRHSLEPDLSEVTLSMDGLAILREQHSWPLDGDGRAVYDVETPVQYERWWPQGLRVSGTVHPHTRKIIDTE